MHHSVAQCPWGLWGSAPSSLVLPQGRWCVIGEEQPCKSVISHTDFSPPLVKYQAKLGVSCCRALWIWQGGRIPIDAACLWNPSKFNSSKNNGDKRR